MCFIVSSFSKLAAILLAHILIHMLIKINKLSIVRFLLYLTIISAFMGALIMSFEIGSIHLFPYRYMLFIMCLIFLSSIIVNNGRLYIANIKIKLYLKFLAFWLCYSFLSVMWAADKVEAFKNLIFLFTGISMVFFIVY